jgi:hypothetical protein
MMLSVHAIPLALQLAVPVLLLGWFARGRHASISQWLVHALIVGLYLVAVHVTGLWLLLPWYTAGVFGVALVGTALLQIQRARRLPWRALRIGWVAAVVRIVIATFAVAVLVVAVMARRAPEGHIVELQFPLRNGVYYVTGGGSVELLNSHLMTLKAERFRAYRGQSHGVDLVKLDAYGMRASGWLPADLARYVIYGDPVHAPCAGAVVQAEDGAPDMPPPQPDRTRIPGNHVLLNCDGVHVLIGHLQPGTVRAQRGQWIDAGEIIGLVGNSGNSNEPHLHVHAQRPAVAGGGPFSGEPLPILFNGRYLVRNDRITASIHGTEK